MASNNINSSISKDSRALEWHLVPEWHLALGQRMDLEE